MKPSQFIRLARVPTLAATAVPIVVGGALAWSGGKFEALPWLDMFVVASLMQIATNALNEYGDHRHAIDTVPGPGFAGIIVSGEVSAREVLLSAAACYVIAFLLGMLLVLERGALMLGLGVAAILAGLLYSEGPVPISSTPFGELLVGLMMGPIEVVSADLAAAGAVSQLALLYSAPVALMVMSILLTNNLRDLEKDREHGRLTLAVLLGRRRGSALLLALITSCFLWSVFAYAMFPVSRSVFLVWLVFPVAVRSYLLLASDRIWPMSVVVVSRLHILFGIVLAVSILLRL